MTETVERTTPKTTPSERSPESGDITWFDVPVSNVEHWVEEGDFVFRSLEFDVEAADSELGSAVSKFIDNASDFRDYLDELDDRGENEEQMLQLLNSRFSRVASELERQERARRERFISISFGGHRRRDRGDLSRFWHPRSTPPRSSSQPSRV